jgi:NADH dehydrogenase FAD-containing subunit
VDSFLRALGHENIHVIGDAACVVEPPSSMPMGCKTAMPMGTYVAESLARLSRGQGSRPFDYLNAAYCISLGRRDGLVQLYREDGAPRRWVFRGRLGAWLKELVCRAVAGTLAAERRGLSVYAWSKTGRKHSPEAAGQGRLAA